MSADPSRIRQSDRDTTSIEEEFLANIFLQMYSLSQKDTIPFEVNVEVFVLILYCYIVYLNYVTFIVDLTIIYILWIYTTFSMQ